MELWAGIDVGGTTTQVGLVDASGRIVYKNTFLTGTSPEPHELIRALSVWIQAKVQGLKGRLVACGIGAPNGNIWSGCIEHAPNLTWKGIVRFAELTAARLKCPVQLTNDANAAALGEMRFGSAGNKKEFLFITLGTGLGSGIVTDGKILYGHSGFAGELGHVIMYPGGRACGCGRKGCSETYCSATGLVRTYRELTGENENHTSRFIYEKAREGEAEAIEAFDITCRHLGLLLANSVAVTSPECIYLFGGLSHATEFIFPGTIQYFEENLQQIFKGTVQILPSALPEHDAAILGAVALVHDFREAYTL